MALYKSSELTILKAAVLAGFKSPPHDHRMWVVIGVYEGQENNTFYRRSGKSLERAGGKDLKTGGVMVLGEDAIHAIENPAVHLVLAAVHRHTRGGNALNPCTATIHQGHVRLVVGFKILCIQARPFIRIDVVRGEDFGYLGIFHHAVNFFLEKIRHRFVGRSIRARIGIGQHQDLAAVFPAALVVPAALLFAHIRGIDGGHLREQVQAEWLATVRSR